MTFLKGNKSDENINKIIMLWIIDYKKKNLIVLIKWNILIWIYILYNLHTLYKFND